MSRYLRRLPMAVVLGAALLVTASAEAGIVAADSFEGYTQSNLSGKGSAADEGWTGGWATTNDTGVNVNVVAESMAASGVDGGTQAIKIDFDENGSGIYGPNATFRRGFTAQSGTVYTSFLLNTQNWDATNFLQFYLFPASGNTFYTSATAGVRNVEGSPYFARIATLEDFGATSTGRHMVTADSAIDHTNGTTSLVVLKLSKGDTDGDNDVDANDKYVQTDLWINPSSVTEADNTIAATAVFSESTDYDYSFTSVNSLALRLFNVNDNDTIAVDRIVLGTDFASVVPEPSTWLLMILGLAGMWCIQRRWS